MSINQLFGSHLLGLFRSVEAATPVAAEVASEAYTLSAGRLWSFVAIPLGLVSLAVGGLALSRVKSSGRRATGRAAGAGFGAGLAGAAIGVLIVAAAEGGPGTGYGIVGGYLAVLLGLSGAALGGLAMLRSRRRRTAAV